MGDIRVDPLLAPLHGDPRFEALAEKIIPAREFTSLGTGAYRARTLSFASARLVASVVHVSDRRTWSKSDSVPKHKHE